MKIEQIYTGCLAEAAYYIESNGEVAIIDPLREVKPYIERANKDKAQIKYVFETHFHADFVSGHVTLSEETGAKIIFGPGAKPNYDIIEAIDEEIFELGSIKIKVIHTPGHTPESSSYLLIDETGKEHALFTGDTLFIGDVGRPDLAVKSDLSQDDLAKLLYHSLRNKIMPLPNDVIVYPAHGAGSACGKNMSKETFQTLGNQKETNYALRADMSEEEFVNKVLTGLAEPPQYFPKNVLLNKEGYTSVEDLLKNPTLGLSIEEFKVSMGLDNILILDTRHPQTFNKAFIPSSINIGLSGQFAPWVGALIKDIKQPILLITEPGQEEESIIRLARVGYDNVIGYLNGGIDSWINSFESIDKITSISANELETKIGNDIYVLDIRKESEYESERIDSLKVENLPLSRLHDNINALDKNVTYHIHCASGYRSMIFSSILKSKGFDHIIEIAGGFKAISKTGIQKTTYLCPSTIV